MSTGRIGSGCSSWRGRRTRQLPLIPLVVTADLNLNCSAGVKTCVSGVTVNRAVDGVALMIASSQTWCRGSYDGPCLVIRQADCGTIGQDLLQEGIGGKPQVANLGYVALGAGQHVERQTEFRQTGRSQAIRGLLPSSTRTRQPPDCFTESLRLCGVHQQATPDRGCFISLILQILG